MVIDGAGPAEVQASLSRRWPSWPLKVYCVGIVALLVVAAGTNVVYQRATALGDARRSAAADAGFGARIAAPEIAGAVGLARTTVATTAASPGLVKIFDAPVGCTLNFAGAGPFATGHLDIIAANGTVACSSLAASPSSSYSGAEWLAGALEKPILVGPLLDTRSGKQVVLAASPIAGKGAVVAFLDLDALGPGLASKYGGPRQLEFVVTSADDRIILARSIDPALWVGASTDNSSFAGVTGDAAHRDLDGTARVYGQATVEGLDWKVYAGANRSEALAAANQLSNRGLVVTVVGLVVFLVASLVIYRRVARPIRRLSTAVRHASAKTASERISIRGVAEVETLVDDFNGLIAAASREVEASSRLAAIVESSTEAIVGKTLDGVITTWNAGAEHMYGYAADEIIGHNISDLIPEDRQGELTPILARVRHGKRTDQLDTKRLSKDGRILDVLITVSPIRDAGGQVIGMSSVSRDMTELNRAEAERRALADRLRQSERLESLGQLAGGIAHDFNNVLNVIFNYATFIADETDDSAAVRADVKEIQRAAEQAARLTNQLLIFARRETVQPESLDLNAIVTDVHSLLSRSIGEHIEISVLKGANLPSILADRGQMEQVLVNLAVNARDAMPQGGTLTIATSPAELNDDASLHPDARPGQYVQLAVSDTGVGMSRDVLDRIFEPFFTTKSPGEGTGLGLATVYGIVTAAGGAMNVDSEEGVGTTFHLYFPLAEAPVATTPTAAAPLPRGQGEKILVVEDEPGVLELTARILNNNGYVVLAAASVDEAVSLAANQVIQLLITDSVMPQMSGRTLAERIDAQQPGLPVLQMSGYSPGVIGPHGVHKQGIGFLQKPFDEHTLLERIHATLTTRTQPPGVPEPSVGATKTLVTTTHRAPPRGDTH